MQHTNIHPKHPERESRERLAFTLMELMVTLSIIVLLLGFLASALGRTTQSARQTASQRSAEAIAASVEQFRLEFGFLPPLVHDGEIISQGSYRPWDQSAGMISAEEGPLTPGLADVPYQYQRLVVWNEGYDFDFFRRRDGSATDEIELPSGGSWGLDDAWDDRRYSRYALSYYLMGSLPRSVDGVPGQGMSRPLANGGFVNVGYPIGSTRDRYEPTIDADRQGIKMQTGYVRPIDLAEHGVQPYSANLAPQDVYSLYEAEELDQLTALVDAFGTAFRYYRWEHGRYNTSRQLVIETSLDLNIPPVLLDPEALVEVMNDDSANPVLDVTGGNPELRQARFAIVGAGADRLFGTEPIEHIVRVLNAMDPDGDPGEIARIRKLAMDDNVVAYGK